MSRKARAAALATIVGLAGVGVPLLAHHSEAAEYDSTKPVKVTGVVRKVEWTNPHIWFYIEGKDEVSGLAAVWGFSGAAPNSLRRRGINRDALKIGDTIFLERTHEILVHRAQPESQVIPGTVRGIRNVGPTSVERRMARRVRPLIARTAPA